MTPKNKTILALLALALVAALVAWFSWSKPAAPPTTVPVPPQPTLAMAGSVSPTTTQPIVTPPTSTFAEPPGLALTLTETQGLKLGTTLALLAQAYTLGGPAARQLANVAHDQIIAYGIGGELRRASAQLRNLTPQEGPVTPLLLMSEAIRIEAQQAPTTLPQSISPTTPSSNWLVRQLSSLIHVQDDPNASATGWRTQIRLAQMQLARGSTPDALLTLTATPLDADDRLTPLRTLTRQYLDQQANLTNLLGAYARTFLNPRTAAE